MIKSFKLTTADMWTKILFVSEHKENHINEYGDKKTLSIVILDKNDQEQFVINFDNQESNVFFKALNQAKREATAINGADTGINYGFEGSNYSVNLDKSDLDKSGNYFSLTIEKKKDGTGMTILLSMDNISSIIRNISEYLGHSIS